MSAIPSLRRERPHRASYRTCPTLNLLPPRQNALAEHEHISPFVPSHDGTIVALLGKPFNISRHISELHCAHDSGPLQPLSEKLT